MRLVVAVVNPSALSDVRDVVLAHGASGITITEAHGLGHEPGHAEVYRGATFEVDFVPRLRLEVLVEDDVAVPLAEAVAAAATTGHVGDGKVWVTPVEAAVRISTGERGLAAL